MFKYVVILLLSLSFIACKKYKYKEGQKRLPKLTTKGKSTFACYIDNNTYKVKYHAKVGYNRSSGYMYMHNETRGFEFRLFVYQDVFSTGMYQFSITGEELLNGADNELWGVRTNGRNELEIIKIDTVDKILSGKFNMDLYNADSSEYIEIREGRFDLQLYFVE